MCMRAFHWYACKAYSVVGEKIGLHMLVCKLMGHFSEQVSIIIYSSWTILFWTLLKG